MRLPMTLALTLAATAFAGSAMAQSADDVLNREKCSRCHTATTTKKAPSFADVAKKYKGNAGAADKLFAGLKSGGKMGDEDDHKKIAGSDAEIRAVVAHVLAAK